MKLKSPRNVIAPVTSALRSRVPRPKETAAAVVVTTIKRGTPRGGGTKKAGARILVSERDRKTRVVAARNATLKWNRLFTEAAGAALLVTTTPMSPVLLGLAGLVIVGQARSLATMELDERHGAVIYVMWRRHGHQISQRLEMLLPEVNAELKRLDKRKMGKRELREILDALVELGCLNPTMLGWLLRDKVWLTI